MTFELNVILRFTLLARKYDFEENVILRFTLLARIYDF
jgi:hypothetical protein